MKLRLGTILRMKSEKSAFTVPNSPRVVAKPNILVFRPGHLAKARVAIQRVTSNMKQSAPEVLEICHPDLASAASATGPSCPLIRLLRTAYHSEREIARC